MSSNSPLRWSDEFAGMTREQAERIRWWRTVGEDGDGESWRSIAWLAAETYGGDWARDDKPLLKSNQLAGEDLCKQAAQLLGEDPNKDPWN